MGTFMAALGNQLADSPVRAREGAITSHGSVLLLYISSNKEALLPCPTKNGGHLKVMAL